MITEQQHVCVGYGRTHIDTAAALLGTLRVYKRQQPVSSKCYNNTVPMVNVYDSIYDDHRHTLRFWRITRT